MGGGTAPPPCTAPNPTPSVVPATPQRPWNASQLRSADSAPGLSSPRATPPLSGLQADCSSARSMLLMEPPRASPRTTLTACALVPALLLLLLAAPTARGAAIVKRSYNDQSVRGYLTERACWWNEICKEEFQTQFRCKCPQWSFCRSPGRYYNAYCTVTGTGYIWTQPGWGGSAAAAASAGT